MQARYYDPGPAGGGSLKISVADAFNLLIYPRLKARQLLLQFSKAIAMDILTDVPTLN